jgi:drug/metabolite transporter (DMT)-like permease
MKGLIFGFLAATSGGIMIDIVKVLLIQIHINDFELIYLRSLFACVIVSIVIWFNRETTSVFKIDREVAIFAFGRVFGSFIGFMLEILSLDYISTSKSVLIINNPLITSILSYVILREKSGKHDLICFIMCTFGVVLLTNPFSNGASMKGTN